MTNEITAIKDDKLESSISKNDMGSKRTGKAHWQGNLKDGKGTVSSQTGLIEEANYSYKARFEDGQIGTNPEELLATAHAGCFTMQVAGVLTKKGFNPTSLDTVATVFLADSNITKIHLSIVGTVENISTDEFSNAVKEAEETCIISRALRVPISSESFLNT